jgi:hypothetical protein
MKTYGTSLSCVCTWSGEERAEVGDYLHTAAGSWYLVVETKETRNPARVRMTLIRTDPADLPLELEPGVRCFVFSWNSRSRRRPG